MKEVWKPIEGFDGYEVSNSGRVRSFLPLNGRGGLVSTPRILKQCQNRGGYLCVTLHANGKQYSKLTVHRLVLEAFVGLRPERLAACHGQNGKLDNSLANLEWGTISKNNGEDRLRDGTAQYGEKNGNVVLTAAFVLSIREKYATGDYTQRELAIEYGISASHMSKVIRGISWSRL